MTASNPSEIEGAYQKFIRTAISVTIASAAVLLIVFFLRLEGLTIIPVVIYQYLAVVGTMSVCAAFAAFLIKATWHA